MITTFDSLRVSCMTTSSTLAHIGLDIGSTTVKLVILDRSSCVLYARYQRHLSDVRATVAQLFHEALKDTSISGLDFTLAATGSGAIALTDEFGIPFVQEVIASAESIRRRIPDVDVTIRIRQRAGDDDLPLFLIHSWRIIPKFADCKSPGPSS